MGNPLLKIQCKVQTFNLLFAIFDRKSNHFMLCFDIPIAKNVVSCFFTLGLEWSLKQTLMNIYIVTLGNLYPLICSPAWTGSPLGRASSASCWILLWWTTWGGHAKTMSFPPTPLLIYFSLKRGMKKWGGENNGDLEKKKKCWCRQLLIVSLSVGSRILSYKL